MAPDLGAVDWRQLGETAAMGLVAALAAFKGAQRVWKNGLGELLRSSIEKEVKVAMRSILGTIRKEIAQEVRAATQEEVAPLREEVDGILERVAWLEGAMLAISRGKPPPGGGGPG
jgi:hypothetical protein